MTMGIAFSTANAAFTDEDGKLSAAEVRYVLEQVIRAVEAGDDFARLRDSNGNRIGFFKVEESASQVGA